MNQYVSALKVEYNFFAEGNKLPFFCVCKWLFSLVRLVKLINVFKKLHKLCFFFPITIVSWKIANAESLSVCVPVFFCPGC